MILHPKATPSWLELILHLFGVGTSHGRPWTHLIHHGPDLGEATTFPHIVFSAVPRGSHIRMALFPETPKEESRNCPKLDSRDFGQSYPGSNLWLEWGLNQSCSPPWELSNSLSHSICRCWEEVYSRFLVVGRQTTSLTPSPSFAHNLGWKCPNGSWKVILDIYTSRPFHWYK